MGTTLIIVELMIIGCEVLTWVVLLLRKLSPTLRTVICLDSLKACSPLLATFAVAIAYTLGVVGDRFLGHASTLVQTRLDRMPYMTRDDAQRDFYMTEIFRPHAHDYFQDSNRQIRLLRATCFNSVITALVLLFFYRRPWKDWKDWKPWKAWVLSLSLLFLGFVSGFTWYMTDRTLRERLYEFYSACQKNQERSPSIMETKR